jgi:hypothetical protein
MRDGGLATLKVHKPRRDAQDHGLEGGRGRVRQRLTLVCEAPPQDPAAGHVRPPFASQRPNSCGSPARESREVLLHRRRARTASSLPCLFHHRGARQIAPGGQHKRERAPAGCQQMRRRCGLCVASPLHGRLVPPLRPASSHWAVDSTGTTVARGWRGGSRASLWHLSRPCCCSVPAAAGHTRAPERRPSDSK